MPNESRPFVNCPLCGRKVRVGADHPCPANAAADARDKAAHAKSLEEQATEPDLGPAPTTGDIDG